MGATSHRPPHLVNSILASCPGQTPQPLKLFCATSSACTSRRCCAHCYVGSGQNFHCRIEGNWAAINIQRSQYSSADEVKFTVNLGTASTVVRLEDGYATDDPAAEVECHWRARLGELLPGGEDRWWTVRERMLDVEVQALGESIAAPLVEVALPRLAANAPDRAILDIHLEGEPMEGMAPATMDVVGPILRRIGPPDLFARYLEVIDRDGATAASLY